MKPKLPKGYRWLKVGQKRPVGYMWWWDDAFAEGLRSIVGQVITEKEMHDNGPYIAPIRKRRGVL